MHTAKEMKKEEKNMEFTIFSNLPVELRLMIWECVPQPRRVVGQIACPTCAAFLYSSWPHSARQRQQDRAGHQHRDCGIRFVAIMPRDSRHVNMNAIFPPLHACRESRAVWLRRYDRVPSRYLTGKLFSTAEDGAVQTRNYSLHFDVPFISYEADIFTIFRPLTYRAIGALIAPLDSTHDDYNHYGSHTVLSDHNGPIPTGTLADHNNNTRRLVDPFMGLDRNRIRHVAIGEDPEKVGLSAGVALNLPSLLGLETLWILSFGPRLQSKEEAEESRRGFRLARDHPGFEITPEEAVRLDCTGILNVPERAVVEHHALFGTNRPHHQRFLPRPHVRPLICYRDMLKAWLWHSEHSVLNNGADQVPVQDMFMFEDFVLGPPPGRDDSVEAIPRPDPSSTCPLVGVSGCGPSGHAMGDIMTWVPRFEMRHLLLYDMASGVQEDIFANYGP